MRTLFPSLPLPILIAVLPTFYYSPLLPANFCHTTSSGFVQLSAGLSVGFGGLAAGYSVGIVGDVCVRAYAQETRLFVTMVLILIFAEVLGLYGLIVALILNTKADNGMCGAF
ncbi:hypothetical protein BC936DRAFT_147828 [Jimgerdemannia flammicorona]|uniref:V-ATPase proteolipid subunit C-like domain-containing protein n=1 Tax=Jimgerdemannia flammicorona TaxID=994334 RepID=A0A433D4E3_9FUNG|nr:hypothetical protein BC936DRAFT_147828 [Jimgerdemannia flammicorona]